MQSERRSGRRVQRFSFCRLFSPTSLRCGSLFSSSSPSSPMTISSTCSETEERPRSYARVFVTIAAAAIAAAAAATAAIVIRLIIVLESAQPLSVSLAPAPVLPKLHPYLPDLRHIHTKRLDERRLPHTHTRANNLLQYHTQGAKQRSQASRPKKVTVRLLLFLVSPPPGCCHKPHSSGSRHLTDLHVFLPLPAHSLGPPTNHYRIVEIPPANRPPSSLNRLEAFYFVEKPRKERKKPIA
ncbi:hypothetical protein CCHR01_05486 [Colletotrichum chrysophilum]|uniref:Uncharacterized protein n=1 Tax=Colletotrichum chrysophilum TaxID=1836956 RepID=A0AAD9AP95_9PEZI|nr:hypothetical protein CCHR01_05486 [Colletotrichum chrysophilum]